MSWGMQKNKETYKKRKQGLETCIHVSWGCEMGGGLQNVWWGSKHMVGCKGNWKLDLAKTSRRS